MATGITESDVWTAADALLLEGARPTIERVRQKIGRGSPNTVSPYLETWFKALGARIRDPRAFASQEAVPDPVAQAVARLWDAALELARAEQTAAQRDAQAELAAQRQANADEAERLRQHALALAAREDDMRLSLAVAGTQLEAAESRLRAAEAQLRQRDAQWDAAQAQLAESRAAEQALQAQAEQARDAHAQAQSALESRHAAHERRWLNELDAERSAAKRLQSKLDEAVAASQRKTAALEAELLRAGERQQTGEREAQARFAEQAARLTRLEAELAAAHSAAELAAGSARAREESLEQLRSAAQTQTAELQARIREQDGQLAALTRHLMMLTTPAPAAPEMATGQGSD
ncbi:DNA-binding protein [Achromobacter sp. AONIH1]|uniref:DNA-binding protein n=1 Tax=Achromobacter sp. AONIH1 TaxID=1758194 RepID=UPI000CD2D620|nr:DNA-binding protein [Achromobacter sp. AONIH1]AUT48152.1 hypothetical protein C2U31_20410 [Achromobacter sp. AONIH1]